MDRRDNQLRVLMAIYAVMYLAFGLVLLIYPDGILKLINRITDWFGAGPPLEIGAHPFWAYVTVSLLFLVAVICFLAFRDVRNGRQLIWLMIFAKYVSSVSQLGYFAFSADHPPGFVIGALTDWSLGTVALVFLLRASSSPQNAP
ncbi:MAG: hypothetical protein KJ686_05760 [Actinobacteria bacterium]|nr:hypothetical protein [Actinomycetota bacterium]